MLAVPVEGNDVDEDESFHQPRDRRIGEGRDELGMFSCVLDPGMADDLQPRPVRIIHQEQGHAIVDGEVAGGEQLAVALVIGKGELRRIDHAQKSPRPAAMLHVGPAVLAHGREIKGIARGDESAFLFAERVALGCGRQSAERPW